MRKTTGILVFFLTIYFVLLSPQAAPSTHPDSLSADSTFAVRLRTQALNSRAGYKLLEGLCGLGPRLSGSEASLRSVRWIADEMRKSGYDTVYLQEVYVPHWERGRTEKAVITSDAGGIRKKLRVCALGGSVSAPNLTAEVVEVTSFEELSGGAKNVKGKIIFYNVPFDESLINTFSAYGKNAKFRVYGAIEAARAGAVGVIVRSITSKKDNVPHTGVMAYRDTVKKIPGAAIGVRDAEVLHRALQKDPHLNLSLSLDCRTLPDALSYNVIGEIRGSEHPEEIILSGGHFDSWDKGQGAHDDGAGCVHAIESVLLLKQLGWKPRHTLRSVLFINEENGSRGAARYAAAADSLHLKHAAAIESDRGGYLPQGFNFENNDSLMNKMNVLLPALAEVNILWLKKGGGGVDIGALKNCGARIGFVPDCQRYFDVHHSDNDVFSEVHPREFELGSAAIAFMLYLLDKHL